jgi:hypothetical protein
VYTVCWAGSAQGFKKTRILVLGVFPEPKLDSKEEWMRVAGHTPGTLRRPSAPWDHVRCLELV